MPQLEDLEELFKPEQVIVVHPKDWDRVVELTKGRVGHAITLVPRTSCPRGWAYLVDSKQLEAMPV